MLDHHVAYLGFAGHWVLVFQIGADFFDYKAQSYYKMADCDW